METTNFGPNILAFVWDSGGPSADDVDLEVDLKATSGQPQANLRSTWMSTSSAQISKLTQNKWEVAIWGQYRRTETETIKVDDWHRVSSTGQYKRTEAETGAASSAQHRNIQKDMAAAINQRRSIEGPAQDNTKRADAEGYIRISNNIKEPPTGSGNNDINVGDVSFTAKVDHAA